MRRVGLGGGGEGGAAIGIDEEGRETSLGRRRSVVEFARVGEDVLAVRRRVDLAQEHGGGTASSPTRRGEERRRELRFRR